MSAFEMLAEPEDYPRFARRLLFQENLHRVKVRVEEPPTFIGSNNEEEDDEEEFPNNSQEVFEDLLVNQDTPHTK